MPTGARSRHVVLCSDSRRAEGVALPWVVDRCVPPVQQAHGLPDKSRRLVLNERGRLEWGHFMACLCMISRRRCRCTLLAMAQHPRSGR